jgi:tRNA threonylcarbamoyladenosine biosynthesis protein TsaB
VGLTLGTPERCIANMGGCAVILGIETSVEHVGVAVGDSRGIRAESMLSSDRRHAESLAPIIEFVMSQSAIDMRDLSAVAVDVGPGLFTGMRVGIATAETIAWALDIPVVPVCSLDALSLNVGMTDSVTASILDARRGEVYWALYRSRENGREPERLTEPRVSSPEDVAIHLAERAEPVICVGTGATRYEEILSASPWIVASSPRHDFPAARSVVALAVNALAADRAVGAAAVEPMYLRAPDAEINWVTRDGAR